VRFNIQRHLNLPDSAFYAQFEPVAGMEVLDEQTIEIALSQNRFDFIYILGQWGSVQVSPTAYGEDGEGFAQNPVGTGPFKFEAYEPGSSIDLVRNDDYWGGAPLLDGIKIRIIPEPSVQLIEVEAGTLDAVDIQAKDAQTLEDSGIVIEQTVTPGAQFISLNLSEAPTNDLAVRQAIARAINRDTIIDEVLFGFAQKSRAGVNSASPYYTEEVPSVEFDPEEAVRILEEAGWVAGSDGVRERDGARLSVSILSTDFSGWGLYNQIIQEQLGEVGIASEISTLEWNAYLDQWRENQGGWNVTYHSQGTQVASTAAIQASWIPDSFWTITQIDDATDPELVELAAEMQSIADEFEITLDLEDRKALALQAQQLFYDNQLTVWLWHAVGSTAINPRLKGYTFGWAGRIIELDKAWID
jgi:peptide/nickel transport system substrate-binding protein